MIRRGLSWLSCCLTPLLVGAMVVAGIWFYPTIQAAGMRLEQAIRRDLVQIKRETSPRPTPVAQTVIRVELQDGTMCYLLPQSKAPAGGQWYSCGAAGYLNGPPYRWQKAGPLVADLTIDGGVTGTQVNVLREWR